MTEPETLPSPLTPPELTATYARQAGVHSRFCMGCGLTLHAAHKISSSERAVVWIVTGARPGIDPGVIAEHPAWLCEPRAPMYYDGGMARQEGEKQGQRRGRHHA